MRKLALLFLLLPFSLCTYGCSERPTESNTVAATDGLVFAKRVAGPERKLDYTFVLPEVIHIYGPWLWPGCNPVFGDADNPELPPIDGFYPSGVRVSVACHIIEGANPPASLDVVMGYEGGYVPVSLYAGWGCDDGYCDWNPTVGSGCGLCAGDCPSGTGSCVSRSTQYEFVASVKGKTIRASLELLPAFFEAHPRASTTTSSYMFTAGTQFVGGGAGSNISLLF
jgi:hypothetical protein